MADRPSRPVAAPAAASGVNAEPAGAPRRGAALWRDPPRLSRRSALLAVAAAAIALVGFRGVELLTPLGGSDAQNYLKYASYLADHHRPPPAALNPSEYSTPPLYEGAAGLLNFIGHRLPALELDLGPPLLAGLAWLALAAAACAALSSASAHARRAGAAGLALAALWALDAAVELGKRVHFSEGQLLSLAGMFALVGLTALIARELWPDRPRRWLGACAVALAYPIVFRMGIMFHPEMTLAWVCGLAVLLLLRARRRGWPWRLGAATGVTLGLAATVRQSSSIVIVCIGLAALLGGGRRALPFLGAGVICLALVAGPWWAYATHLWGSPIKLALDRSGHMVSGEPFSFFVSFPIGELVTHPYRPDFSNQLLPGVHADLWSDYWGSLRNQWMGQSHLTRITASTQSVLGFGWDALGLLGLATLGLPALSRLLRRASRDASDFAAGFLALLAIGAFAAFTATIVRYPQAYGKEIKAIYMLFTTPCWAIFTVSAWLLVARRSGVAARVALPAFAGLYALSYATSLYTFLR